MKILKGGRRMPHKLETAYIYMIDNLKQERAEKDKYIARLYQLIFDTRETIRHIVIVDKSPVKGTTKEDCYTALEKLQELYDTNRCITTSTFLDQIEKG